MTSRKRTAGGRSSKSDLPTPPPIDPTSSLSPEALERDLLELAATARAETWTAAVRRDAPFYVRALLFLCLAGASSAATHTALSPIYGAIPSSRLHFLMLAASYFAGWSGNLHIRRLLPAHQSLLVWTPLLAAYLPVLQAMLARVSGPLGPRWGPTIVEALTLFPLVSASVACAADALDEVGAEDQAAGLVGLLTFQGQHSRSAIPRWLTDSIPGLGVYTTLGLAELVSMRLFAMAAAVGGDGDDGCLAELVHWAVGTRVARQLVLAGLYALASPSRLLWYAVPALLHAVTLNPHLAGSTWALAAANRGLQRATDGWVLLDRRESVTGYLSVAENPVLGIRVLRCDHSLLGGEWLMSSAGLVPEPIYGVFTMLEAVRLVETVSTERAEGEPETALVIGLGVGTAPAALVAHGIATTVVEIDPAVHAFAQQYFHLPANHTAVLEDAVAYTDRLVAQGADGPRFDYIVHDVFTGGAEPISLFTREFLQNLHTLLAPAGVVAINYGGDLLLGPIKAVVHTIRAVFPQCRIFREHSRGEQLAEGELDFDNVVIYCTRQADRPLTFRALTAADTLNTQTRQQYLMPRHEVMDTDLRVADDTVRMVQRNDTAQLESDHMATATGHWWVMRQVVAPALWELW